MNLVELKAYLKSEEEKAFSGWDFSYLNGRWENDKIPWDYKEILLSYLKPTSKLLDMGTGGGEFLLSLNHPYELTSVTEAYPPNVQICKDILSPLGIDVRQVFNDSEIPFESDAFDIVINRHEAFDVNEVKRVLKSGGCFVTQQVGGKNNNDLSCKLIDSFIPQYPNHDLSHNSDALKNAGFEILLSNEAFTPNKLYDLGALVYLAKIIEWEFPSFSVDLCFENLLRVEKELQEKGYISGTQHSFIIVAKEK